MSTQSAMDPNLLRHMDYFSVPNNQTVNPVDQNALLNSTSTTMPGEHSSSIWDTSSLPNEATSTSMAMASAAPRQPNPYTPSTSSKTVLPTRAPPHKFRDGHERKRSKLSTDASTTYDSVDYWMNFENGEGGGGGSGTNGISRPNHHGRREKRPGAKRAHTIQNPLATPSGSGIAPENGSATGGGVKSDPDDGVDDSALDNALSDDDDELSMSLADHLSKIDTAPPADVPQREGLYSTPLSWEKPQPGLRMDSLIGLHNNHLNEADQQRLIAMAMNPGPSTGGLGSTIASTFGPAFGAHAYLGAQMGGGMHSTMSRMANIPTQTLSHGPTLGRNMSPEQSIDGTSKTIHSGGTDSDKGKGAVKGDRTAHNDIERKYRTNLKVKIAELRDAVPALRPIPENGVPAEDGEGSAQPGRAPKVSKGTVLTKATEYIQWLERRNKAIMKDHAELSKRLQAYEQLLNASARAPYSNMPNYSRDLFDPRGFC